MSGDTKKMRRVVIKCHGFYEAVEHGNITLTSVQRKYQIADFLIKALNSDCLIRIIETCLYYR